MILYPVGFSKPEVVHANLERLVPVCSGAQRRKGSGGDLEPSASAEPKQKQGWFSRGLFNKSSRGRGDKADSDDDMRSVSSFSTTASLVRALSDPLHPGLVPAPGLPFVYQGLVFPYVSISFFFHCAK